MNFMNNINENYLILNEIFTKKNFSDITYYISFYFDNIILEL